MSSAFTATKKKTHIAHITHLSHDGRGIANLNGKVTFLRGGLAGEKVEFTYLKQHRQYDEGQVLDVLEAAAERIAPVCEHFGVCGGCSLQHMQPTQQITMKQLALLDQLARIGGTQPETILPPLTAQTTGYRHKARLGVKYVPAKGKVLVGFRELNGRYITDMQRCAVLHPSVGEKLTALASLIQSLEARSSIPQIEVAVSDDVTGLIFRHLEALSAADQAKLSAFASQANIHLYLQPGGPKTVHKLWPTDDSLLLQYALPEQHIVVNFHPSDFTQVNPQLNRQMVARALSLLDPQPHERILDLFCGLGNFTLPLARYCQEITGVEGEAELIARATDNAKFNQLDNIRFYTTDLSQNFSEQPWAKTSYDKILLDPPRTGALEIIQSIAQFKAKLILYISCNPATLARDSKELIQQGYRLTAAGVMDMFPHTSHVESIALFRADR